MKEIETEIRRFLGENFAAEDEIGLIGSMDSLTESGIIDSTGVLELVTYLQDRYTVRIPDDEIVPENFDSLAGITRYIIALRKSG